MAIIRKTGYDRVLLEIRSMTAALAGSVREILLKALATLEAPEQQQDWRTLDNKIDKDRDLILDRIVDIMSLSEILQMASHLRSMYDYVLGVFKDECEMIKDLDAEDDKIDQGYATLQKKLLLNSQNQSLSGELGLALVLARTLERLGDHVVNVGEMQVYIKTGRRRLSG